MHSMKLSCVRRHWMHLLLGAAVICSAAPAQAARGTAGKVSFADLPSPALLLPGSSSWIGDTDDCVEEEVGAPRGAVLLAANSTARTATASPQTRMDYEPAPAQQMDEPILLAALQKKAVKAAPVAAAAAVPLGPSPIVKWDIRPGDKTLNGALARWAQNAGWQLVWEVPVDYAVEAETSIPGTFEHAIETVTKSMETAEIPLKAIFYKGNSVIRIVVKGAE
jgi:hypothetical protein